MKLYLKLHFELLYVTEMTHKNLKSDYKREVCTQKFKRCSQKKVFTHKSLKSVYKKLKIAYKNLKSDCKSFLYFAATARHTRYL